jgi:hypothetical protein
MQNKTGRMGKRDIEEDVKAGLTLGRDCGTVKFGRANAFNEKTLPDRGMAEGMDLNPGKKECGNNR